MKSPSLRLEVHVTAVIAVHTGHVFRVHVICCLKAGSQYDVRSLRLALRHDARIGFWSILASYCEPALSSMACVYCALYVHLTHNIIHVCTYMYMYMQ